MIKKLFISLLIVSTLIAVTPYAGALSLQIDGAAVSGSAVLYNSTTYVPLRLVTNLLRPDAEVSWENGCAVIRASDLTVTASPGDCYIEANGRMLYATENVKLVNGTTMVPIRALAKALGATVTWDGALHKVTVKSGSGTIVSGSSYYDSAAVYWLSRIINAESEGEPIRGKIAVGNVVLNRVASSDFPNSIYAVIFDSTGGVQFTPVANGTIYNTPTEESILAAKLCLDGASVVGGSLFFLNPSTATSSWISRTRAYIATIGNHAFYA